VENQVKIVCPHCHQPSDSIKRLQIWMVIYLLIGISIQRRTVTACQSCMREQIGKNAAINILSANILWPFIILPHSLIQLSRSYGEGHDKSILAELRTISRPSSFQDKPKR
jgi:hypothetical protein